MSKTKFEKHEWSAEADALLGTMSDQKVSQQLGTFSREAVRKRRGELGIPCYRDATRPWTPETDALLGTMHDIALARKLGVTRTRVWNRRRLLGISAKRQFSKPL